MADSNPARTNKPITVARHRFERSASGAPTSAGDSPQHKQAHWLARAAEAERAGDAVQAEHWYRVAQDQP